MSLPYVVLEFDKNEVLILASGGTLETPQWQFTANFDVSRKGEVTLHLYLRAEMVEPKKKRRVVDTEIGPRSQQDEW